MPCLPDRLLLKCLIQLISREYTVIARMKHQTQGFQFVQTVSSSPRSSVCSLWFSDLYLHMCRRHLQPKEGHVDKRQVGCLMNHLSQCAGRNVLSNMLKVLFQCTSRVRLICLNHCMESSGIGFSILILISQLALCHVVTFFKVIV